MEGVEILNQFEVVTESVFNMQAFWITVGIAALIGSIIGIISVIFDGLEWNSIPVFLIVFTLLGIVLGVAYGAVFSIPTKYETHYQVTTTDEVKMTEFNERYEILDQEGKIYTVRER